MMNQTQVIIDDDGHVHSISITEISGMICVVEGVRITPAGLCGIASGPDAWMQDILLPCQECGQEYMAGSSDSETLCPQCWDDAGWDNAIADGHAAVDADGNRYMLH